MQTINCFIDREIYTNNGFHIYAGRMGYKDITVKSNFDISGGNKKLVGIMGKYNGTDSFQCHYEEFDNNSKEAQKNLLMSIKGIKEATADLIVNAVDDINIFRKENYPKIKGIGPAKVNLIREGLQLLDTMQTFKEVNILLGANCSQAKIRKVSEILETFDDGIEKLKENPYYLLIEHAGFGFKAADKIALSSMGIKPNDKRREKYLVEYIVKFYTSNGNCFITDESLQEKLQESSLTIDKESIINNDRLEIEDNKIYTKSMYNAETKIPDFLNNLIKKETSIEKLDEYTIEEMINEFEQINKIKFDKYQKEAINICVNNNASILTGGAGTGKTTVLKAIIYCLNNIGSRCYLTAPTGKAARRMEQSTGQTSSTIHSFINKATDGYTKKNCIMIVDEFSMVDTELFYDLLDIMEICPMDFIKIIFVGDPGQLPSVQPGNCLNDLIESKKIPTIKLVKTFRQKGESNIIDIATKIRGNEDFDFLHKKDFYVKELSNTIDYKNSIKYFFNYLYEKYQDIDLFYSQVQFIAPMKKGDLGVLAINEMLKNQINPRTKKEFFPFDVNDKIMCIKNDRENGIMNGESGRIIQVEKITFTVFYKDLDKTVTYKKDKDTINNFQLSYCSTVHKLQGSEFKYIVIVLPQDSMFIDSRLLYTGITRGKETVILLTNKSITSKIVKRNNLLKRNTNLKDRLINQID